jgi:hypothetical protein
MFSAWDSSRINLLGFASEIKPATVLGMLNIKYHFDIRPMKNWERTHNVKVDRN